MLRITEVVTSLI